MTLLYASTFAKSLDRLTAAEQKQVKITTVDLMLDPTGNGLQMHRVEKTDGFWTARVSQDIRLVVHKDGERTLLAYVDHHDAAYRWAERRRLVAHERTGAMQLVELVERTEERLVYTDKVARPASAAPIPVVRPFRICPTTSCSMSACRATGWVLCGRWTKPASMACSIAFLPKQPRRC